MIRTTDRNKLSRINRNTKRLLNIAYSQYGKGRINVSLAALSAYCDIQYSINQEYTDEKAEKLILSISDRIVEVSNDYVSDCNTVLYYDGFGLDLRGWAASFAKALSKLDYRIIYVAPLSSRGSIPHIEKEVCEGGGTLVYVDTSHSYVKWIRELNQIFEEHRPKVAFFYTTPNDVCAAAVFDAYYGKVKRIQIDLTDHAFWIGVNAFDFAIESRMLGASNMVYYRGVEKRKIMWMDCCPYINRDVDSNPLPFDIKKERFVFSGGSLYKTLGDANKYFYKIIDYILDKHSDIKFLYAGTGDETELLAIGQRYPKRVFRINERSDFMRLFDSCLFYLNTYPMFGGLMMRYAAMAGKVPLTLRHKADQEGILYNQDALNIEFDSFEDVVREADRLIEDCEYRRSKEKMLVNSVQTEEGFVNDLRNVIENSSTDFIPDTISKIDTSLFRAEYINRLNPEDLLTNIIPNRRNLSLGLFFPVRFIKKGIKKIILR